MSPFFRQTVPTLCLAILLMACAQNTVRLVYEPAKAPAIPPAGAPQISVIQFKDARSHPEIGQRSGGGPFIASSSVGEWYSHAFATELAQLGMVVTFAVSEEQARSSGATYVATGVIEEVWLTEQSSTSYQCVMRASLILKDTRSTMLSNSFSSSLARRVVPLSSVPQEMLSETAGDLANRMAYAVQQKLALK